MLDGIVVLVGLISKLCSGGLGWWYTNSECYFVDQVRTGDQNVVDHKDQV